MRRVSILIVLFVGLVDPNRSNAQQVDSPRLSLERIFSSGDFSSDSFGPTRWLDEGMAYSTLEPSKAAKDGRDIVRYDCESGRREVLVPAAKLIPPGGSAPLALDDYSWYKDGNLLLIY